MLHKEYCSFRYNKHIIRDLILHTFVDSLSAIPHCYHQNSTCVECWMLQFVVKYSYISPKTLPNHLNDSQASAFNICFDSLPLHFLRSLFTPHTACVLLNKFDVNEFDASMPRWRVRMSSLICCMLCMIYSMANIVKCMKIRFPNYTLHIYSCIR